MPQRSRRHLALHRPVWDVLEERVVLSHGPASSLVHQAHAAVAPRVQAHVPTIGAVGDSYTDEYRFYPPDQSHARNWVEILANTGHGNFGPFRTRSRGEPRDQGFAFNWARLDATSANMVQNQLPGLAAQVAAGQVQYAWVFVGGNDFLLFLRGVQRGLVPLPQAPALLPQIAAQAAHNFDTAVIRLLQASPSVRLVVATVPPVSLVPAVQAGAQLSPAFGPLVAAADQAVAAYDQHIRAVAAHNPRIALVDLAAQAQALTSPAALAAGFSGTPVTPLPGNDYHHLFVADGIHIGTILQGVLADDFLTAIDQSFGAGVPLLSQAQIVNYARLVQARTQRGGGPP